MLPLSAAWEGPGGCGCFLSRPYLAEITLVSFWKVNSNSAVTTFNSASQTVCSVDLVLI